MRVDEYQKRRRILEEQLQADLELIRAGYRAKLQALELHWLASAEKDAAVSTSSVPEEALPLETQGNETQQTRRTGSVEDEVEAIFPRLPDLFDKDDVIRLLGWEPHRATLHRAVDRLRIGKKVAVETRGEGRRPTRYRKVGAE